MHEKAISSINVIVASWFQTYALMQSDFTDLMADMYHFQFENVSLKPILEKDTACFLYTALGACILHSVLLCRACMSIVNLQQAWFPWNAMNCAAWQRRFFVGSLCVLARQAIFDSFGQFRLVSSKTSVSCLQRWAVGRHDLIHGSIDKQNDRLEEEFLCGCLVSMIVLAVFSIAHRHGWLWNDWTLQINSIFEQVLTKSVVSKLVSMEKMKPSLSECILSRICFS